MRITHEPMEKSYAFELAAYGAWEGSFFSYGQKLKPVFLGITNP